MLRMQSICTPVGDAFGGACVGILRICFRCLIAGPGSARGLLRVPREERNRGLLSGFCRDLGLFG